MKASTHSAGAGKARHTDVTIAMSDGVELMARIYQPNAAEPAPTLFAASPYRFDNDDIPQTGIFLWHETGPIHWYVDQGYAYVHLDVRGSGRSGGEYGYFDRRERRDLFEVIEWIAAQPWCNGRVGGIGHSYYAASQWCMAAEQPPHLACIAPYDGHFDFYGGWAYQGGIPSHFISEWWNNNVRPINRHPANGGPSRALSLDLPWIVSEHPELDAFWQERAIGEALRVSTVPVYSVGVWAKLDLHLAGNIGGFARMAGPKKLFVSGVPSMPAAQAEFDSIAFHERVLLPFYDQYLRGQQTDYAARPPVQYQLRGTTALIANDRWPPTEIAYEMLFLSAGHSGSVTSLNDGSLSPHAPAGGAVTAYSYPDPHWMIGNVTFGAHGPDPVRRVLTFTSEPLQTAMTLTGPAELILYLATTSTDADVIVKLSEQFAQSAADRAAGLQPRSSIVTKGWLRASRRHLDQAASKPGAPVLTLDRVLPLEPGTVAELRVPLMPAAWPLQAGSRIRVEVCNADSPVTDAVFGHSFTPDRSGTDTIHHSAAYPSRLLLPLMPAG